MLEDLGCTVLLASNGREALREIERERPDLVLMDCQMPEMDGYDAATEIRKREGDLRRTTIIAMTANALDGDRERCLAAGMDDYISKPVRQETLSAVLERWSPERSANSQSPESPDASESAEAGSAAVIDQRAIADLRRLQSSTDADFFNHLIDLFVEETPRRLTAMSAALAAANPEALAHEAHALKGSSGHMGATRMNALCDILEEQGRAGSVTGAPALLSVLEEEFARVQKALEAEKNPPRGRAH